MSEKGQGPGTEDRPYRREEASSEVTEALDLALEASRRKNAALEAENDKRLELATEQERELLNANKSLRIMKSTAPALAPEEASEATSDEPRAAGGRSVNTAQVAKWKSIASQAGLGAAVAVVNLALVTGGFDELPDDTNEAMTALLQFAITQYVAGNGIPTFLNNFVLNWGQK